MRERWRIETPAYFFAGASTFLLIIDETYLMIFDRVGMKAMKPT